MNFTREPIIETIITSREGYRLLVRNTKGGAAEEYSVEALEVVSFGTSIFYRSLERPKSFLLPVGDYEVVEVKEARVALKAAAPIERSIKIGGGNVAKETTSPSKEEANGSNGPVEKKHNYNNKKKSRRRKGGGGGTEPDKVNLSSKGASSPQVSSSEETPSKPPVFSRLFPPPLTLIKEKLSKSKEAEIIEANLLPEKEEEKPQELPQAPSAEPEFTSPEKRAEELIEPEPLEEPIYNPDSFEEVEKVQEEHPSQT